MEPFPFFRRPYYYYDQGRYINQYNAQKRAYLKEQANQQKENIEQKEVKSQAYITKQALDMRQKQSKRLTNKPSQKEKTPNFQERKNIQEDFFLEIFGIELYFDDILIIALIFFLYNEGVRDNFLFISLILLLLS